MPENNNISPVETSPISLPRVDDIDKKIAELTAQNNEYQNHIVSEEKSDCEVVPVSLPIDQNLGAAEALQNALESHRNSVIQADAALTKHQEQPALEIQIPNLSSEVSNADTTPTPEKQKMSTVTPNYDAIHPESLNNYTPEQLNSIETMNLFQENLPNTFMESSSKDNEKILVAKESVNISTGDSILKENTGVMIITKEGITFARGTGHNIENPNQYFIKSLDANKILEYHNSGMVLDVDGSNRINSIEQKSFTDFDKIQMAAIISQLKFIEEQHKHDNDEPETVTYDEIKSMFV